MSGETGARWRLAGAICLLVVVLDQIAKAVVEAELYPGEIVDVLGPVKLTLAHNEGVAFGMAGGGGILIVALAIAGLGLIGWLFAREPSRPAAAIATGLIAGGALGNLIDRVRVGEVTDFIDILSWPPFNLADIAISAGILLLVLSYLRHPDPHP